MIKREFFLAITALAIGACAATPDLQDSIAIDTNSIKSNPEAIQGYRYVSTGQPDNELLAIARDAGVVAVIDLRGKDEQRGIDEPAAVEALGMRYVALPVADESDVTYENAELLRSALRDIDGPVMLHCLSGNRVGALFALQARQSGASVDEALAVGERAGLTRYRNVVRERLETPVPTDP